MPDLQYAFEQLQKTRGYTLSLLEDLTPEEWFAMPGGVTNVAWQVGHLAMVEFRLCLERLRDLQPDDREMISKDFQRGFGRGTTPVEDPADSPSAEEIRATFDRVHQQVELEVPKYAGDDLSEPLINPHPMFATKLDALLFCSQHEMLHAGQIGMVRRLLGKEPVR